MQSSFWHLLKNCIFFRSKVTSKIINVKFSFLSEWENVTFMILEVTFEWKRYNSSECAKMMAAKFRNVTIRFQNNHQLFYTGCPRKLDTPIFSMCIIGYPLIFLSVYYWIPPTRNYFKCQAIFLGDSLTLRIILCREYPITDT